MFFLVSSKFLAMRNITFYSVQDYQIVQIKQISDYILKFQVCKDPAQEDGPWKNKPDCKPHMSLNANEACEVCGYQVGNPITTGVMMKTIAVALTGLHVVGMPFQIAISALFT